MPKQTTKKIHKIELIPPYDIATALRVLAERIDKGEVEATECVIIYKYRCGNGFRVDATWCGLGCFDTMLGMIERAKLKFLKG